jgi:TRAP-type C4-dicarboxylate transport system substrate-binding protein
MLKLGVVLSGLLIAVGAFFHAPSAKADPIQVNWLIAHEPVDLFDGAAQAFETEFNTDGDGAVQIHILGPKDFGSANGHLSYDVVSNALDTGKVQLATVVVGPMASTTPELGILSLPFLFKDYASAGVVLDGPVASQLLKSIDTTTNNRGLAFTFSGGLMVIESNTKQIHAVADFKGLKIGTVNGSISEQTLRAFGAIAVPLDARDGVQSTHEALQYLDGIETPYTRIATSSRQPGVVPTYINETDHSFFLTVILASDSFYDSLSPQNQIALRKAAQAAALIERRDSIALAAQKRQTLKDQGKTIVTMSSQTTDQMKVLAKSVYTTFENTFGNDLVDKILQEQQ